MSKVFNKALIAAAVLAASAGLAYANGGTYAPEPVVAGPVHNCYVGVAVSRDFAHFKFENDENFDFGPTFITTARNADLGNDGWDGQINLGYGGVFQDHYYLGAEIFGEVSNVKAKFGEGVVGVTNVTSPTGVVTTNAAAVGFDGTVKLRYEYGIALIPGVKVSDSTMLYGRIGWVRGKFRANVNPFVVSASTGIIPSVNVLNLESNHTSNGLQLGIGLETMVTNNCSVKVEYDWDRYSNTFGISHPTVDKALVGVAYHFVTV
jgi:outer membrane immunogenic protein